jgi:signal transduction histidine kinase
MMVEFALPTFSDKEINRALKLKTEHNQINAAIAGAVVQVLWYAVDYVLIPEQRWNLLFWRTIALVLPLLVCLFRRQLRVNGKFCLFFTSAVTSIMIAYVLNSVPHSTFHTYVFGFALVFIGVGALAIWERIYSISLMAIALVVNILFFHLFSTLNTITFVAEALFPLMSCAMIGGLMIDNRRTIQLKEIRARLEIENSRKLIEEQKNKLSSELDNFVYSVSHDLRSPLLSVKGILTLLYDSGKIDKSAEQYLRMAESSIDRLDKTIQDILEYSRNSRLDVKTEWFDLSEVVKQIFDDIQFISETPIRFEINIEGDSRIFSDKTRVSTIIKNLVSNAAKYRKLNIDNCYVAFHLWRTDSELHFKVSDNGIGIPIDQQEQVFNMFYRLSTDRQGTGLGLFIVQEIISKLGGSIQLESEVNKGTAIQVSIPETNSRVEIGEA